MDSSDIEVAKAAMRKLVGKDLFSKKSFDNLVEAIDDRDTVMAVCNSDGDFPLAAAIAACDYLVKNTGELSSMFLRESVKDILLDIERVSPEDRDLGKDPWLQLYQYRHWINMLNSLERLIANPVDSFDLYQNYENIIDMANLDVEWVESAVALLQNTEGLRRLDRLTYHSGTKTILGREPSYIAELANSVPIEWAEAHLGENT